MNTLWTIVTLVVVAGILGSVVAAFVATLVAGSRNGRYRPQH
jgi:hypothetical protein